jgi:hypothetical protein
MSIELAVKTKRNLRGPGKCLVIDFPLVFDLEMTGSDNKCTYTHIDVNNVNIVDNQQLKCQHKGQHFLAKVYIVDCQ